MNVFYFIAMLFLALPVSNMAIASNNIDSYRLACQEWDGKKSVEGHFITVQISSDQAGYGFVRVNALDEHGKPGPSRTYFKGDRQSDDPDSIIFTTRQNPDDIDKPADFLELRQIPKQPAMLVTLVRLDGEKVIGKMKTFLCALG